MADFTLKRNDRLPALRVTCKQADGTVFDLTGCTVAFHLRNQATGSTKVNSAATLVTAASGIVEYQWAAIDVDTAGLYHAEFEVTQSGKTITFPNNGHLVVEITEDLV